MKIYISGPMSGYKEMNFPAFHATSARLRNQGYTVISPAEVLIPQYPPSFKPTTTEEKTAMWVAFMREDIKYLMDADVVAVLPNWEDSKGAVIEVNLAKSLGMEIICADTLLPIAV
jgi:nucleoside 2-deoxyribosyltransferase